METTDVFDEWFEALDDTDKENVLASLLLLQHKGPQLPRPYADTVKASKFVNMKELRTQNKGNPIRSFYAFDPERTGIVLCAGEKTGKEKRFYVRMISVADNELEKHLTKLSNRGE
ncbi:type II toxin-antitoxin system RelE/ParE family toxin [Marinomonas algarum]|uniref:Type II toxin-antitoxin system RelE/ParE family toxin n=1 Tax=Marinomonas algarum TaxID=2883105 RepID=A0A9X1IM11_9GAMM|nr:type II toxin-antitoxin system RelE/ParE family toxin [Marinomonas algarum]